ncbi:MAG: hypothetical protein R3F54_27795 [Alphaproteobacteria bacterium]
MSEVVVGLVSVTSFEGDVNGIPERFLGSRRGFALDGPELGEELLDGIEVRAAGRQAEDRRADAFDGPAGRHRTYASRGWS